MKTHNLEIRTAGGQFVRVVTDCDADDIAIVLDERQRNMIVEAMEPEIEFLRGRINICGNLERYAGPLRAACGIVEQIQAQIDERDESQT